MALQAVRENVPAALNSGCRAKRPPPSNAPVRCGERLVCSRVNLQTALSQQGFAGRPSPCPASRSFCRRAGEAGVYRQRGKTLPVPLPTTGRGKAVHTHHHCRLASRYTGQVQKGDLHAAGQTRRPPFFSRVLPVSPPVQHPGRFVAEWEEMGIIGSARKPSLRHSRPRGGAKRPTPSSKTAL